jgi:HlyD family secretion protein
MRSLFGLPFVVLGLVVSALAGCSDAVETQVISVTRGTISESLAESGRTQFRTRIVVAMPVSATLGQVTLSPGDRVVAGVALAEIDTYALRNSVKIAGARVAQAEANLVVNGMHDLEQTLRRELEATVEASFDALKAADASVAAERKRTAYTVVESRRLEKLSQSGGVSEQDLDEAQLRAKTAQIELSQALFSRSALGTAFSALRLTPQYVDQWLDVKRAQRGALLSALRIATAELDLASHQLKKAKLSSAIDGLVVARHERGGRVLPAGTPVLEVAMPNDLQLVAELLTEDALRVSKDTSVLVRSTALTAPVTSTVLKVEPLAFTKRSPLGVEQQRVNVIVALPDSLSIGAGYQVELEFQLAHKTSVLIVPRESLVQLPDGRLGVYAVRDSTAQFTSVRTGVGSDYAVEILEGLSENQIIVAAPSANIRDGVQLKF